MTVAKLIIPLGQVPEDALITKRGGGKLYTVVSEIKIYVPEQPVQVITATDCKFICNERGQSNAISNDTEVIWCVQSNEINDMLEILGLSETEQ